jgi:arylsulfatase A-like enzyme
VLNRREFVLGSCAAASAATAVGQRRPVAAAAKPNIVIILADDLPAWMVGCYGNKEIRTPNIDRLAAGGIRFNNAFVATPICSPSRATFFTGRLPRQHGIHDFLTAKPIEDPPQGQAAPPESFASEVMLSDVLAGAGYECAYVGKWHMGGDARPGHGHGLTYTIAAARTYEDPVMFLNGEKVEEKGYLAELMTAKACSFLDKQTPSKPFLLTLGYLNPHLPLTGHPQRYYDMYAETPFTSIGWEPPAPNALREKELLEDTVGNIRKTAAATTALDDQIPVLLNKLRERGLLDNTLILFTGDNGFLLGRHGLWSKGHASNPINMYDEVVRVPLIMNWPGKIPTHATTPEMVSFYDMLPTLCEAAGVSAPAGRGLTGRSFLPIATRSPLPKDAPWRNLVFAHFRNTEMARDARFKLVLRNEGNGPNELYDLTSDPREKVNHYESPQYVTVRDRLAKEIAAWRNAGTGSAAPVKTKR